MRLPRLVVLCGAFLSSSTFAKGGSIGWDRAEEAGEITVDHLPEASGIAQSKADPNRLYHINDAGSSPSFVVTDRDGSNPRTIDLKIESVKDMEDLAMGACPDAGDCLYIGDIGDNKAKRPYVSLYVVRDALSLPDRVSPVFQARLVYDDGEAHNAESLAIHPSGYAYVLTKEIPAVFYRFPLSELTRHQDITLEKVGSIDLTPWLKGTDKPKQIIPTSMDIRPDGKQIVILTRAAGLSLDIDLAQECTHPDSNVNRLTRDRGIQVERLPMIQLPQSEAVTYVDDGMGILYSSELAEAGRSRASLIRINRR